MITRPKQLRNATLGCALLFVLGIVAIVWTLDGCAARVKNVTDLPANVTQKQAQDWDTAVANLHKIATATSALRQAAISTHNAGGFPSDRPYMLTLTSIARIDALQIQAANFLKNSPQTFGQPQKDQVKANITSISDELRTLNTEGVTGITNQDNLKTINGLIADAVAAANLVLALVQ